MLSFTVVYSNAKEAIDCGGKDMELTELEKKLLDKLEKGLLDGFILPDLKWKSDGMTCRRMIVGGIPYYISFMEKPSLGNRTFIVDQYYETDEMKLWFLKQNGHLISDLDVREYSSHILKT